MLGKVLSALSSVQAWFGSALGSLVLSALRSLEYTLRVQDHDKILATVRIIERVANTAIDICLKIRAVLQDGRVDAQEVEQLTKLIQARITEIEQDKARIQAIKG